MELPKSRFEKAIRYLPEDIQSDILSMPSYERNQIQEVRLRIDKPASFTMCGKCTEYKNNKKLKRTITSEDLEDVFEKVCDYSLHSFEEEIRNGYVTVDGGHRVGFCGSKTNLTIKNITSINIRIANELFGCGEDIAKIYIAQKKGILIAGLPLSGKTTILRDVTRILGNEIKVSLIDERNEIAAKFNHRLQNDVGKYTDVLSFYEKTVGIETATRVLSPDVIVCDEIVTKDESKEILHSANTGVGFIATVHANDMNEVLGKKYIRKMLRNEVFKYIIFLDTGENVGKIKRIVNMEDYMHEDSINSVDTDFRLSLRNCLCK